MKFIFIFIFLLFQLASPAQKLDLVVISDGTSIACKIDSVTDTEIYFHIKSTGGNWAQTKQKLENVTLFKYDFVDRSKYTFVNGTSFIDKNAQLHSFHKNSLIASVGSFLVYHSAIGSFERILSKKELDFFYTKPFARLGIGRYSTWGDNGTFILPQFGVFTGASNSHLEMAAGFFIVSSDSDISLTLPLSATIGYRYQEPDGNFIGRIGVGFPEAFFVSMGIAF